VGNDGVTVNEGTGTTPVTLALCLTWCDPEITRSRSRKKTKVSEKCPTGLGQGEKVKERPGAIVVGGPPALGRASRVTDTAERKVI